ncbi:MAG TPA: hypothetical protein VGP07_00930 [Polyangia bacterium]|jgi:hypothetical protein
MKINGPGQPPASGTPTTGEGEGVASTSRTSDATAADATAADARKTSGAGKAFAEKLAGTSSAQTDAAARRPGEISVKDLAAELTTGKLDARGAVDQVIDRVVNVQLGQNAPAHVREQVQAALRDALESDPLLAEKLRGLG